MNHWATTNMESAENMCVDIEEWRSLQDPKSRRRIQNRIAQRVYRRKRKAQRDAMKRDNAAPSTPPRGRDSRQHSISECSMPSLSDSISSSPQFGSVSPDFCAQPLPPISYIDASWASHLMMPVSPPLTAELPPLDSCLKMEDHCLDPASLYHEPSIKYMTSEPLTIEQPPLSLHNFDDLYHDTSRSQSESYYSTASSDSISTSLTDTFVPATKGLNALQTAAAAGHELIVNLLIDEGANVEDVDASGATALHLAAGAGYEHTVGLLLSRGANIGTRDHEGRTALHCAAQNDHDATVNTLLQHGAYIDPVDNTGSTPLHLSADQASQSMVSLLLDNDANVSACDATGRNALHRAADKGHAVTVKLLLDRGIDIHARADSPAP